MSAYDIVEQRNIREKYDNFNTAYFGWGRALDEVDRLHRLLHDLTPGGSEFVHDPDRCAAWVKNELNTSLEAAVKAHGQAKELRRLAADFRAQARNQLVRGRLEGLAEDGPHADLWNGWIRRIDEAIGTEARDG